MRSWKKNKPLICFLLRVKQVFDATNTTRERRETIIQFAEQNGFKVTHTSREAKLRW